MIINIIGIVLIIAIIAWFWVIKPKSKSAKDNAITIIVEDGVYKPATVKAKAGEPLTLTFIRKDNAPCSSVVVFDGLNKSAELPVDKAHKIELMIEKPGKYEFACQMKMYQGSIIAQ